MCRYALILTLLGLNAAFTPRSHAQVIDRPAGDEPADVRLLAGLAGYPPNIVDALASISGNPDLLRVIAQRTARGERPNFDDSSAIPAAQRDALRQLSEYPDIIAVAADDPELSQRLATAWHASPSEFRSRLLRVQDQGPFWLVGRVLEQGAERAGQGDEAALVELGFTQDQPRQPAADRGLDLDLHRAAESGADAQQRRQLNHV